MDQLPIEMLVNISNLLDYTDKLILRRTCKRFFRKISVAHHPILLIRSVAYYLIRPEYTMFNYITLNKLESYGKLVFEKNTFSISLCIPNKDITSYIMDEGHLIIYRGRDNNNHDCVVYKYHFPSLKDDTEYDKHGYVEKTNIEYQIIDLDSLYVLVNKLYEIYLESK